MGFFQWKDTYSVGVQEIDEQHKKLIEMVDQLHTAMASGKGKDVLGPILDGLVEYTQYHFTKEEELMRKHFYPELPDHKKEHEKLVKEVTDFQNKFKQDSKAVVTITLLQFLKDWLAHHILGTDKKYSGHFALKGVK